MGFLEVEVTIEAVSDHKEGHFQLEPLGGHRMNRLWQQLFDQTSSCFNPFTVITLYKANIGR